MSDECSVDVLKLDHDPPEDFGECVCNDSPSAAYLFIRDLIALCQFGILICAFVAFLRNRSLKLYIFFDFWTQMILFFSSEIGLYGIVRRCSESESDYDGWDSLPWYCRVYWALLSMALPSTILSNVVYWTEVYKNGAEVSSMVMNSISPAVAILEFILIAFPIRLLNFFYFVIFYAVYVLFTMVYQKRGGTGVDDQIPIYRLVDWRDPRKACLNCFVGLAIGLGAYFIICFISMAKMACRNRNDY